MSISATKIFETHLKFFTNVGVTELKDMLYKTVVISIDDVCLFLLTAS